ncbi:MAG: PD-(D/E)XK nuclease family protein [Nanoarchaeota archaeon]|nr:PD-(D/E)XK nuclease family protein [Nanoarchaeota archaeon]
MSFKLDHISVSQYSTWSRCQKQWYFRYIEGLRVPPNVNMIVGSGVHSGAETIYRQKKALDTYNLNEALDATRDYIEYSDANEEVEWDKPKAETKDTAVKMLRVYSSDVRIPDKIAGRHIEGIEIPLSIKLKRRDTSVLIKARPDLVLTNKVVDIKTAGRKPSSLPMNVILQTHLYAIALKKSETEAHYIIRTKNPTAFERNAGDVTKESITVIQNLLINFWEGLQTAIKSGNFLPTGITHDYACAYCGYGKIGLCKYSKLKEYRRSKKRSKK